MTRDGGVVFYKTRRDTFDNAQIGRQVKIELTSGEKRALVYEGLRLRAGAEPDPANITVYLRDGATEITYTLAEIAGVYPSRKPRPPRRDESGAIIAPRRRGKSVPLSALTPVTFAGPVPFLTRAPERFDEDEDDGAREQWRAELQASGSFSWEEEEEDGTTVNKDGDELVFEG